MNIALIGCGMIGREHIERTAEPHPQCTASLLYATYLKKVQRRALRSPGPGTKVYTDFNEAINDPDVNAVRDTEHCTDRLRHDRP